MKKLWSVLTIMVLLAISPVLAVFCHNCGKELPNAANFCPGCGKASAIASQPVQTAPTSTVQPVQPVFIEAPRAPAPTYIPVTPSPVTESSLGDYNSVNQMELLLTNTNYSTASRQAIELRYQHDQRMAAIERNYHYFSPYQKKLHDLHLKKFQALETYLEAWKSDEQGPDKARAKAEKDKALFILAQVNEAIDTLLTGGGSLASLAKAEEMENRLKLTSANYVITAPYILVENQRLNRGEPIWIIDVVSGSAKVLHMGRGRSSLPICGWVSIYDLEKRSNWRSNPAFFYSAPTIVVYEPPPPPVKVVICGKKRYPYRHDRDRHDHDRHDKGRYDDHHGDRNDDRHDGRNDDKKGDHRRHNFVVIDPLFW